ncbi:MAG: ankyrin repeat domain-containing protein [Thermoguttaceae bacterium]|nr:ankyrin repeat domain-containing protein [Thermoguttaceae bacterium]
MSFDYNPRQKNNPEFDLQAVSQTVNAFNEEKSKKPPVPLEDVALGVSYYYSAIKTAILTFLVGLALVIVYVFIAGAVFNSSPIQEDNYTTLVGWFTLLIMVIVSPFLVKSMSCFCRTPSIIYRNAKSTVIISWTLWIIAFVMMILNGSNANDQESSVINVISSVMYGVSAYLFMSFISSIGKFCLPKKKGCTAAIVLIMIYYVISVFSVLNAGSHPENLNSAPLSKEANSASGLTSLGSLLCLIGGIMYLSYIEKLNKFFKTKMNINQLKKENSKKSTSSILIALVVFSVLGLIGYLGSAIPNMKNNAVSNITYQQILNDYDAKETKALNDWSSIFGQFNDQKMTDEQFDDWLVNTHIPAWKEALSILETSKENDNPSIDFLKTITQDRIAYCNSFHKALQQHSKELYKKAFQEFQRVDLKVLKLSYTDTTSKDVLLQILHKAVVADDLETVKWAISNGVDVNEAIEGITPLHRARIMNLQNMIDFLKENGATE